MKTLILIVCAFALANGFYVRPPTINGYRTLLPKIKPLDSYQPNGPSPRIIGGAEAEPHSRPFQAAVFIDGGSFCGGSLIDANWCLTAGHCTTGASSIEVVLGAHFVNENEATQQSILSSEIITQPDYGSVLLKHDVGLVRLSEPANIVDGVVEVIALPEATDEDVPEGKTVTVSGWGKTADGLGSISPVLKVTDVVTITNAACAAVYGSTITDATICTSFVDSGTCNGDSGGPLTIEYAGRGIVHIGVVSFVSSAGCESGNPDGYTRTKSELDWIKATTGIA